MNARHIICTIVALVLLPALAPADARAQSDGAPRDAVAAEGGSWYLNDLDLDGSTVDHPTDPVVAIPVYFQWNGRDTYTAQQGLEYVMVSVTDAMGNPVAGDIAWNEGFGVVVWQGQTDLPAGALLDVRVVVQNEEMGIAFGGVSYNTDIDVSFQLAVQDSSAPEPLIEMLSADPSREPSPVCGEPAITVLTVNVTTNPADSAYYAVEVATRMSSSPVCGQTQPGTFRCIYDEEIAEYCADVTVTSLYDNSTVSESVCVANSELPAAQEEPNDSCIDMSDDGGCDCRIASPASGGTNSTGWMAVMILGLALLAHGWRRRQRASPRT